MGRSRRFDVLVVGGGPAGIAAACSAARKAPSVAIVDDNPALGGQVWRGGAAPAPGPRARVWFERFRRSGAELLAGTRIVGQPKPGVLLAETEQDAAELEYDKLVLAPGARERFLPFPGWTLPNVCGAGGLVSLVKGGLPIQRKRVAVAGSGPLLLAAAAFLRRRGADVRLIAEQAPWKRLLGFGVGLLATPGKLIEAAGYQVPLLGVRYLARCWPAAAEGDGKLARVTFRAGGKRWSEPCDYLACGFGLVPNLELPLLLGCRVLDGAVRVDRWQQTSTPGVYCAGEATGVAGLEAAVVEGRIAGAAAVGNRPDAARWFQARQRARRFARAMDRAFALSGELGDLAAPDTVVCRCEDVTRKRLEPYRSWREAKLQTRCGMGACQGRVCGGATELLFGWKAESVRPPVLPARLESFSKGPS